MARYNKSIKTFYRVSKILKNYLSIIIAFTLLLVNFHSIFAQENFVEGIYNPTSDALKEFAVSVADSTPKIIAAIILLIIGFVVGKIVSRVTAKAVKNIIQKTGQKNEDLKIGDDINNKFDSVKLISSTIRWFVYLFFIVAAVNALQFEQLTTALTNLWFWVPNLLAFVLIVVIGSIVVNFVARWLESQLLHHRIGGHKIIISVIKAVIYSIVFAIGFTQLGVGETIIPILVSAFSWSIAIAIGVSIAIGLGFALKDIIPASIIGASNQRSVLKVGQKVKIGDIVGTVTATHVLHIIVTNEKNESIVIPTKTLMNQTITIFN